MTANGTKTDRSLLNRRHYPFVVVGTTFVTLVSAAGVLSALTMFVRPFESEFGWSAGQISMAQALQIALFGLTGPFAAAAMERYGVRKTIAAALALLTCTSLIVTRVTAIWQLLILSTFVGLDRKSVV